MYKLDLLMDCREEGFRRLLCNGVKVQFCSFVRQHLLLIVLLEDNRIGFPVEEKVLIRGET